MGIPFLDYTGTLFINSDMGASQRKEHATLLVPVVPINARTPLLLIVKNLRNPKYFTPWELWEFAIVRSCRF